MESLPDGSYIVQIGDKQYKALPPDTVRQILKEESELQVVSKSYDDLKLVFNELQRIVQQKAQADEEAAKLKEEKANGEIKFWKDEYDKELKLRTKYQKSMSKCSGKILLFRICTF